MFYHCFTKKCVKKFVPLITFGIPPSCDNRRWAETRQRERNSNRFCSGLWFRNRTTELRRYGRRRTHALGGLGRSWTLTHATARTHSLQRFYGLLTLGLSLQFCADPSTVFVLLLRPRNINRQCGQRIAHLLYVPATYNGSLPHVVVFWLFFKNCVPK